LRSIDASAAFLVEVRGSRLQPHQQPGGFLRLGLMSEIFGRQRFEREFRLARGFPQKSRLNVFRDLAGLFHELIERVVLETQQNRCRLHFGPFAVLGLNLQRSVVVFDDRGGLEASGVFVEYVHANT
jgi:hypothetical protein